MKYESIVEIGNEKDGYTYRLIRHAKVLSHYDNTNRPIYKVVPKYSLGYYTSKEAAVKMWVQSWMNEVEYSPELLASVNKVIAEGRKYSMEDFLEVVKTVLIDKV